MIEFEFDKEENEVRILFNTKIYPFYAILLAARDFIPDFWIFIDGDVKSEVLVCIKPKEEIKITKPKKLVYEFVNYVIASVKELI